MSNPGDAPSRIPWPPILLAGVIALAVALDRWVVPLPVPLAEHLAVRAIGFALLIAAIAVAIWTALTFRRHDTTIRPDRPSRTLIDSGPFAYSRNPIYLAEIVALAAAGVVFNRLTLVLVAPLFKVLVERLAVRREEAFLLHRFGAAYEAYCQRVGRWF
jgi:protein-S-isoprenylcysteine O-methyltransferase Ste14